MTLCGTAAAGVAHVVLTLLGPIFYASEAWHVVADRPALLMAVTTILALILAYKSGRHRWAGFFGARFFWSYPPLSLAVLVGMLAYWALALLPAISTPPESQPSWLLVASLIVALLVAGQATGHRLAARSTSSSQSASTISAVASSRDADHVDESFDALLRWLKNDTPVTTTADDRFEMTSTARRIATRLRTAQGNAPSIAILGRRGSGKSTIRNLVLDELRADPRFLHVTISLWPFESAEAAVRGILRAMIDRLGEYVNVLPLRGIADDYAAAVAAGLPKLRDVLAAAQRTTPVGTLERLRAILDATRLHCVLWIDDLERFAGEDTVAPANAGIGEVERLGPIRALLHLLDQQDHVSVIMCDASLRSRFDVDKIAQYIERPPELEPEYLWRVIECVRNACLDGYPRPFIDAATKGERDRLSIPGDGMGRWLWCNEVLGEGGIGWAIGRICRTPRTLKSAMRTAVEAWNVLCGEIDLDDLIVASLLRATRPDVFLLLVRYADHFRSPNRADALDEAIGRKPPQHDADAAMNALTAREETDSERRAVEVIVKFLFPKYRGGMVTGTDVAWMRPQGLAGPFATDYLQRYLTLASIDPTESDQYLLSTIRSWRGGGPSELVSSMLNRDFSARVARFVHQFNPSECCRLIVDLVSELANQRANATVRDDLPPQLIHLGEMLLATRQGAQIDAFELVSAVSTAIGRSVGRDISLALGVIRVFSWESSGPGRSLLSDESRAGIDRHWRDRIVRAFVDPGGSSLVGALEGSNGGVLYLACYPFGVARESKEILPSWAGLAETIVRAIASGEAPILRQVLPFVTWDEHSNTQPPQPFGLEVDTTDWSGAGGGGVMVDVGSIRRLFDLQQFIEVVRQVDLTGLEVGRDAVRARTLQRWAKSAESGPNRHEGEPDDGQPISS